MIGVLWLSLLFLVFAILLIILKQNLLFLLFSLEILLLGANINFIFGSQLIDDFLGKFLSLILFSVAALDTSVGLIILLNFYAIHLTQQAFTSLKS